MRFRNERDLHCTIKKFDIYFLFLLDLQATPFSLSELTGTFFFPAVYSYRVLPSSIASQSLSQSLSLSFLFLIPSLDALELKQLLHGRQWTVLPCSALSGEGLDDGLKWFVRTFRETAKASHST